MSNKQYNTVPQEDEEEQPSTGAIKGDSPSPDPNENDGLQGEALTVPPNKRQSQRNWTPYIWTGVIFLIIAIILIAVLTTQYRQTGSGSPSDDIIETTNAPFNISQNYTTIPPTESTTKSPVTAITQQPTLTTSITQQPTITTPESPTTSTQPTLTSTTSPTGSIEPTQSIQPTFEQTIDLTPSPTMGPTLSFCSVTELQVLQEGSIINCDGFKLIFPENAFPDSILNIYRSDMDENMKELYAESTIADDAMSLDNITQNQYLFVINNDPLSTSNISYNFTIPIPETILNACPDDYGYELFIYNEQIESQYMTWPIWLLVDSIYNATAQTLTTVLYPDIWLDRIAAIIVSCTPDPIQQRRRFLEYETMGNCKADPIHSPLDSERIVFRKFNRFHIGTDYHVDNQSILAVQDGTLIRSGISKFYGPRVILKHDTGGATIYKHMEQVLKEEGVRVSRGDAIGHSFVDSHFHLEYIPDARRYQKGRVDPENCMITATISNIPTTSPEQPVDGPIPVPTTDPLVTPSPLEVAVDTPSPSSVDPHPEDTTYQPSIDGSITTTSSRPTSTMSAMPTTLATEPSQTVSTAKPTIWSRPSGNGATPKPTGWVSSPRPTSESNDYTKKPTNWGKSTKPYYRDDARDDYHRHNKHWKKGKGKNWNKKGGNKKRNKNKGWNR